MPTLPTAEGGITAAEENLKATLAASARFRTWAKNAATAAIAAQRIYIDDLPEPPSDQDGYTAEQISGLRPFAIIRTEPKGGYAKARVGTAAYAEAGKLHIILEENVDPSMADNVALLERTFKNTLGTILDELLDLAYQGGYLAIDLITFHGPGRCSENEATGEGDHHFALFEVQYGVGVR